MTTLSDIPATTPSHSIPVPVIFGAFKTATSRLPYFSCVMSLWDVAASFRLSDEIPKYHTLDWRLQELYQRSLNRERVHDIATRYLRTVDGRPAFFNSITIALVAQPDAPALDAEVVAFPNSQSISLPGVALATQRVERVNECTVPASASFGKASWIISPHLNAVAIDGQHRLAAIQKFSIANKSVAQESYVSIIVLILDKKLGFYAPSSPNTMDAMRGVFIDLNKHAVPVSTARNILLDDASLQAACIRALISEKLNLSNPVESQRQPTYGSISHADGEFDIKVPLAMIDWHGENKSKIDEGPYVTSVLALNWWVTRLLKSNSKRFRWNLPTGFDPDAAEPYKAFNAIAVHAKLPEDTKSRISESETANPPIPFHFNTAEVNQIGDVFGKRWGRAAVTLLCCLEPYRKLIELRERGNTIGAKFSQWYQCSSDHARYKHKGSHTEIESELKLRLASVCAELESQGVRVNEYQAIVQAVEEHKKSSLFFLLVAQRALVISFIELISDADALRTMCELMGEPTESAATDGMSVIARYVVGALNGLSRANPEMFTRNFKSGTELFWAGSILNPTNKLVDFSERASTRTSVWIQLMAHLYWYERSGRPGCAQTLINAYLEQKPIEGTKSQSWCNQALSKLIPLTKTKIRKSTFHDSPINYLMEIPTGKVSAQWIMTRNALAKPRLTLITTAATEARP